MLFVLQLCPWCMSPIFIFYCLIYLISTIHLGNLSVFVYFSLGMYCRCHLLFQRFYIKCSLTLVCCPTPSYPLPLEYKTAATLIPSLYPTVMLSYLCMATCLWSNLIIYCTHILLPFTFLGNLKYFKLF